MVYADGNLGVVVSVMLTRFESSQVMSFPHAATNPADLKKKS